MSKIIPFDSSSEHLAETARKYAGRGRIREALKFMLRACEADPSNFSLYIETVKLIMEAGDFDQAEKVLLYMLTVTDDPQAQAVCCDLLAAVYEIKGDMEKALHYARRNNEICENNGIEELGAKSLFIRIFNDPDMPSHDPRWDEAVDLCLQVGFGPDTVGVRESLAYIMYLITEAGVGKEDWPDYGDRVLWAAILEYAYRRKYGQYFTRVGIAAKYGIPDNILRKSVNTVIWKTFL